MKQTAFLRCFLTQEIILGIKHLRGKMTGVVLTHVQVVVDHILPTQLQRSVKLKISH